MVFGAKWRHMIDSKVRCSTDDVKNKYFLKSTTRAGGGCFSRPTFLEEKWFFFKYKVHALSARSTCHFTSYPGWGFLEKYLIENVENTISEPLNYKI